MSVISTLRLSSVPRWGWAVIGPVAFGLLTDLVWTGAERWASRRRARRHTEATLTEVFFANERSSRPDDAGVPMDRFTSEHVQRIVDYLDRARLSVCLGMYIVTVDSVGDALIRARNRGVRVRVIGCASMAYSSGSQMVKMAEEDIPIRFNDKGSAYLMHHKFCLIDTDWLCPRCYHAERVRRLGFCCDRPANGLPANGSVLPAGHAMANGPSGSGGGGLVANGGGRAAVVPCDLSDRGGSGCARCSSTLRQEKERVLMARGERDPLPVGGIIMTGSTNWTMQALSGNWDNIIVTSRPEVVVPFQVEFQRLWAVFARSRPMIERGAEAGAQQ
uniref:Mitochondrial cardiolipin hydrolase n=1 Tax=Culex tarsalis TaxID=7177 RepID=A0A1Q3EWG5_CULTA